jgi:hypothetical protein
VASCPQAPVLACRLRCLRLRGGCWRCAAVAGAGRRAAPAGAAGAAAAAAAAGRRRPWPCLLLSKMAAWLGLAAQAGAAQAGWLCGNALAAEREAGRLLVSEDTVRVRGRTYICRYQGKLY